MDTQEAPPNPGRSLRAGIVAILVAALCAIAMTVAGPAAAAPTHGPNRIGKQSAKVAGDTAAKRTRSRRSVFGRASARVVKPIRVRLKNGRATFSGKRWFQRRKTGETTMINLE